MSEISETKMHHLICAFCDNPKCVRGTEKCEFEQWKRQRAESEKKKMKENRLDKVISDIAYILDNLILLRNIQKTGDCNICKNRDCGYMPKAGQMVRYNCPFYKSESEEQS